MLPPRGSRTTPIRRVGTLPVTSSAAGTGFKELQARAGHSTTTAAVRYLHHIQDGYRRVAAAMDELLARDDASGDDV